MGLLQLALHISTVSARAPPFAAELPSALLAGDIIRTIGSHASTIVGPHCGSSLGGRRPNGHLNPRKNRCRSHCRFCDSVRASGTGSDGSKSYALAKNFLATRRRSCHETQHQGLTLISSHIHPRDEVRGCRAKTSAIANCPGPSRGKKSHVTVNMLSPT